MSLNFKKITLSQEPRQELHDALGLTGSEISVNVLPAGVAVPFVHSHKKNEEVYLVLEGKGELYIDGKVESIAAGDAFVIRPAGHRAIRAAANQAIRYVCIQTKSDSLEGFTMTDAEINDDKAPWL